MRQGATRACLAEAPKARRRADVAQLVERVLGKDEVSGSIPDISSIRLTWRVRVANRQVRSWPFGRLRATLSKSKGGRPAEANVLSEMVGRRSRPCASRRPGR